MRFHALQRLDRRSRSGFTLVELVLVMAILVVVLTATYRLILDCLDAERTIDKLTIPEKVGEGILALFRQDISGTIWRQLGTRVFYVIDNGSQRDSRDAIKLMSTVEPTPREEAAQGSTVQVSELRTITGICYFVKPNQGIDGVPTLTLYRKEIVEFVSDSPLDGPGQNYEVFDKVAYLSIECYDSYAMQWTPTWDSESMIREEQLDLESAQQQNEGIAKVSKRQDSKRTDKSLTDTKNPFTSAAPGFDPGAATGDSVLLPPAAVPAAVRIELGIFAGQGNKIERDEQGSPIVKVYATIVPILTSQRVRIELDDDAALDGAAGGASGDAGAAGVASGLSTPGGSPGGGKTTGGKLGAGRALPGMPTTPGAPTRSGRGGRPVPPGAKATAPGGAPKARG